MSVKNSSLRSSLRIRIRKGYYWLKENMNHSDYKKNLEVYEGLVNKARLYGLEEKDCWKDVVENMDEREILTCLGADL